MTFSRSRTEQEGFFHLRCSSITSHATPRKLWAAVFHKGERIWCCPSKSEDRRLRNEIAIEAEAALLLLNALRILGVHTTHSLDLSRIRCSGCRLFARLHWIRWPVTSALQRMLLARENTDSVFSIATESNFEADDTDDIRSPWHVDRAALAPVQWILCMWDNCIQITASFLLPRTVNPFLTPLPSAVHQLKSLHDAFTEHAHGGQPQFHLFPPAGEDNEAVGQP
ncbi:hypothetical protein TGPRC2_272415 [Toxoplasma gondii TgCatPRC2]|uniref:Uncharacterized protein n=15 Tax=Toxoplasma gondii TaxID=5811 RepID=A0A125YYG8_TOXGV|nr:hypothetical protein TGME49_272415 [Toxoplasma gondii ME49]EPR64457.1 hypothetical protein TGGT1_272415 [Toxoplasma gondii GT1]ESS35926.1 hypothetical protein TGVEG_272415 [Toxoplasma gondii VEG]KAF4642117.1 hypothetical protein TGRH88_079300 [Toxoplasma gondii]KFG43195.1 hypothetical protein TGDOM2_272415 [Toxoplasma gondii GAB2-2007-GAL-DOM2]KFG50281.1 hypothetical protein TGFOU_272415 [Toxoplasma gondii FOU]KFG51807.1 hypothetical protein TGP89_272415 [Toxoplasma gondii p89]KFG64110.1 |eukprot:XP_018636696.1 hypothetical protein TGME49_272415 [Toxoplasma gondii ME49]